MRLILSLALALLWFIPPSKAQAQDSIFKDYAAYAAFVDDHVMRRDIAPLVQRLGGRDEFTIEQLNGIQGQFLAAWPRNLTNKTVFGEVDLGGGIKQEGRIYWTGTSYGFFYALLHQQDDQLVVINFKLNTESQPIIDSF
jgi:hypothetical protein